MSVTTVRWKIDLKKLDSWVLKERYAIHSCLMNFIGKNEWVNENCEPEPVQEGGGDAMT